MADDMRETRWFRQTATAAAPTAMRTSMKNVKARRDMCQFILDEAPVRRQPFGRRERALSVWHDRLYTLRASP